MGTEMPRTTGSLNRRTNSLVRALERVDGDLLEKLSAVSADTTLPLRMRLDSCKILSGALHGRVRLSAKAKRELKE